jgi:glycosyltransferase involved in cell wall biosynthesis
VAGDDAEWRQIATAGREMAASRYDWSGIATSLYEYYEVIVRVRGL